MGKCVVCGRETRKVLFKDAIVKTYICSEKCLRKYGFTRRQKKLVDDDAWLL